MKLNIVHTPDPILMSPSSPVKRVDKKIKKLIASMVDTLEEARNPEGVGLSAVQVGVPKQIFIIKLKFKNKPKPNKPNKYYKKPTMFKKVKKHF